LVREQGVHVDLHLADRRSRRVVRARVAGGARRSRTCRLQRQADVRDSVVIVLLRREDEQRVGRVDARVREPLEELSEGSVVGGEVGGVAGGGRGERRGGAGG